MPARQASTPGTNSIFPAAISPPVAMQVRSSLANVARAIRGNWPIVVSGSCGARQNLLFAWAPLARSCGRIQEARLLPRDYPPTEADGFRIVAMHARGVCVRARPVATVKPVQGSRVNA